MNYNLLFIIHSNSKEYKKLIIYKLYKIIIIFKLIYYNKIYKMLNNYYKKEQNK